MPTGRVVFAYPAIVRIVPIVLCLACVVLVTVDSSVDRTLFLSVAAVNFVVAVVFRDRIEIRGSEMTVVRLWTSRRYQREDVLRVSWEPGTKVTLELRNGTQASVPSIGEDPNRVAGAIHSWLQQPA